MGQQWANKTLNTPEFVILSVVLHSGDSLQKQSKKLRTIWTKIRSYPDRSMNCTTIGINFDFYPDGPCQMTLTYL